MFQARSLSVDTKAISSKIGFGNISPHPTIYKVLVPGKIEIHGEKYHFKIGEEIVFASWAERLSHPGVHDCVLPKTSRWIALVNAAAPKL